MTTKPTKPEIDQAEKELSHLWQGLTSEFPNPTSTPDYSEALQAAYARLHERSPLGYKLLLIAEGILYKELEAVGITPPRARKEMPDFDGYFIRNATRICTSLCAGMRNSLDAIEGK